METVLAVRLVERLSAVALGGFCIFLGYRLFLALPDARDASGQLTLPMNMRIVLSRVGPGVFFALFGAAIVALSLYRPISYERVTGPGADEGARAGAGASREAFVGISPALSRDERAERADARALLRRDFAELNAIAGMLRPDLPSQDAVRVAAAVERAKLGLMRPVWGSAEEGWGEPEAFEAWLKQGRPTPVPANLAAATELFLYGGVR